ncbi:hypothetical protein ACHAWF_005065 [Thalassiosira exigua]
MTDAGDLRATLTQTDMSAPAIQASSRAMMRFYDRPGGAAAAVSEWRSAIQSSPPAQSLPLLYVANEVLQSSKRNRGSRFLEAFSPVLGSSVQFICGRDRSVVEKVRRVVKIWGDRRIFSLRFVMDVLGGLDPYREGASAPTASPLPKAPPVSSASATTNSDDEDEDEDEDDMFGGDGQKLLDISIDATALSAAAGSKEGALDSSLGSKRRRSSAASTTPQSSVTAPKKPKALSGQNFLDMFQSIANLDDRFKSSVGAVELIPKSYLDESGADVDELVGDELTEAYKKVCQAQRSVRRERRSVYTVAVQRRELEKEARRYVSWLKNLARVDDDDLEFCDKLEKKIDVISVCHDEAKSLRDKRRTQEAQERAAAEAAARQQAEKEERQRILDDAKMEAEAKPGMVWNKELREYQYVHDTTEESWRD